jgi:outer membrane protein OmpA-like peptidoglycan-associated protein
MKVTALTMGGEYNIPMNGHGMGSYPHRALDRLAHFLKDSPGTHVIIEGHTDSVGTVGTDNYNLALSQRRAQAVADALNARGVSADRTETKGLGKAYPVASNDTQAARQQNRRVEIVFSDESGRFGQTTP